jgi:hypothetical protein
MFVLEVQQGGARLLPSEPVCGVLGEQAFDDRSQRPGVQERRRFAVDDRNDRVEQ